MKYADLKTFLDNKLGGTDFEGLHIYPGPDLPNVPEHHAILTPIPGPGLNTEDLFDAQGWQVRCVGHQHDFTDAESMAHLIDSFLRSNNAITIGTAKATSSKRAGGSPYPLYKDDGERVHFVCNYNFDVQV